MIAEKIHLTAAEYLAFERQSEERHEYHGGELRLMAGASRKHNIISLNIAAFLRDQLRGKSCKAFMNDMRLWIESANRYFYPDISVICGKEPFVEEDVASDATIIVEVLSETTEAFDRGKKFEFYQQLTSLQDYFLVSQNECRVEHFHKITPNEWRYEAFNQSEQIIRLESVDVQIPLKEIFLDAELNPAP